MVLSDMLFLEPILASVGVLINRESLSKTYHTRVANYMDQMQINSYKDLNQLVKQGKKYYSVLPDQLEKNLLLMSDAVSKQITQNWIINDQETASIFLARQKIHNNKKSL